LGIGGGERTAGAEGGEWVLHAEIQEKGESFNTENTEGTEKEENEKKQTLRDVAHNL
jgi:hypothetical protein